ncbi:hypothetical protein C5167_035225 [Papaver somniferum]|uniref:CRAL-TRIO domain-containing protein n=1 Tax=Papaver somniferum TaxID=3469 RepID=A0A4Y7KJ06_PAPSO|nr:hypothetical protein C5167_035225 [Papaver somniferum]
MAIRLRHPLRHHLLNPNHHTNKPLRVRKFSIKNEKSEPVEPHKMVMKVKQTLEKDYKNLPVGKNGRDDEDMILWFLKDRKFDIVESVSKLTKAIKWRQEFNVSELSEESVERLARTGKAFVHDCLDVNGMPVLVVVASKHFPDCSWFSDITCFFGGFLSCHITFSGNCGYNDIATMMWLQKEDQIENEKLCVFLIEKALSRLPDGKEEILGIFDFRGFGTENSDFEFLRFLFDVFYYYYPKRLGQVLFVDTPFLFFPLWQLIKPLLRSYASLVRFCSADTVRKEYFTETTVPTNFRD